MLQSHLTPQWFTVFDAAANWVCAKPVFRLVMTLVMVACIAVCLLNQDFRKTAGLLVPAGLAALFLFLDWRKWF